MRDWLIASGLLGAFAFAYPLAELELGEPVRAIAFAPLLAGAWLYGMRHGLALGVFIGGAMVGFDQTFLDYGWSHAVVLGAPVFTLSVLLGGVVGRLRDVSEGYKSQIAERLVAEDALRVSEARWRAVVENAPGIVSLVEPDGTLTFINRTAEGYAVDRVIGTNVRDYLAPHDRAELGERLRAVFERGETLTHDSEILRADGTRTYYRGSYGPIIKNGKVVAAVLISTDMSAVKQAEEMRMRHYEQLVQAQEKERSRIARELHDGVGQALTSLLMGLRLLEDSPDTHRIEDLRSLTRQTLDDLGRLARGLHPAVLDDVGFTAALERHVRETTQHHGVTIDLQMVGFDSSRLPGSLELTLYRIIQEGLHNIVRHASASAASVIVERERSTVNLVIEDDGHGCVLDGNTGLPPNAGLGLVGIRERTQHLGGSMTMETSGRGTTLYVRIPLGGAQMALPKLR
jgi:PAS domain S-box-containing protein